MLKTPALRMGASSIISNGSVKNLGAIFNNCVNTYEHVTSICQDSYCHLNNFHSLKVTGKGSQISQNVSVIY